jgi:hypothetical protein
MDGFLISLVAAWFENDAVCERELRSGQLEAGS